jgi:hypothetical protein
MHNQSEHKIVIQNKPQGLWCDALGLALIELGVSFLNLNFSV